MSVLIMDVLPLCCLFSLVFSSLVRVFCLCQRDCMLYDVHCPFGDSCSYYMPNKWQSAMGPKSHSSCSSRSLAAPAYICIQYIDITVAVPVT